jgi:hypothetical protein
MNMEMEMEISTWRTPIPTTNNNNKDKQQAVDTHECRRPSWRKKSLLPPNGTRP